MPELAVSTWSLHRTLGPTYPSLEVNAGERAATTPYGAGSLSLLETPAYVAAMGIAEMEICHFHFPHTDDAYLDQLRDAAATAGVRLGTLLIDGGDVAAEDVQARERDLRFIKGWIDVAARLGMRRARVVAGATPPDTAGRAVRASVAALAELAEYGRARGVAVITENWQALAARPEHLLAILDGLNGAVGLCADFGNFPAATREADLRAVLPRAVTVHAKAIWTAPESFDAPSFQHLLDLTRQAGFAGSYVAIFDDPGDERQNIVRLAEVMRPYLH